MLERFNALVHLIYEGATDISAWTRIVSAVATHMEAEKGLLLTPFDAPEQGGFIFPHGIGQHHIELWKSRYLPEDLWARRMAERNFFYEGNVLLGKDLTTKEELLQSTWYREFLIEMDLFQFVCGIVFAPGGDVPATGAPFYRGVDAEPFEEEHRERMRLLVPHISRSLGVMFKLRDVEFRIAASLQALDRIRQGILLLDARGGVCFANSTAERILQQQDGLRLGENVGSRRVLSTDDPLGQAALARALQSGLTSLEEADATHLAETVLIRRPSGSTSYAVQVSYLPETNPYRLGANTPRAIVFIKDGTLISQPEPGLLQRVYGLTPAEARAALALCDGGSLDTVAAQLNVKLNTLKTHLKSIYTKTSADNRAALTKLMLSLSNS